MKYFLVLSLFWTAIGLAQETNVSAQRLELKTKNQVNSRIEPILRRLCSGNCEIVEVQVDIQPKVSDGQDMGFEGTLDDVRPQEFEVRKISMDIQIDSRITEENKQRLERIIILNLRSFALAAEVNWSQIMIPRIGGNNDSLDALKSNLDSQLRTQINKVINRYCPDQCILEQISVRGEPLTLDQSKALPERRVVKGLTGDMNMRVDQVLIDMTMDEALAEVQREKIAQILRARTRFVTPVEFGINVTPFPETYLSVKERQKMEQEDPYGLEKLRQMLIMFRDLAGTKEIITNTKSELDRSISSETSSESTSSSESSETTASNNTSTAKRLDINSESSVESMSTEEIAIYVACLILLLTLMAIALMKFSRANKAANEMVVASQGPGAHHRGGLSRGGEEEGEFAMGGDTVVREGPDAVVADSSVRLNLKVKAMKEELLKMFMEQPKVAKDTFSRMIREDGIEETAKYVFVFGHIVVFELLSDPTLQRDLYELSEYYHRSDYRFSIKEEYDLLSILKTRVTASEIRVLTQKSSEKFEFLTKLDAGQIYNLIKDEKIQVQSIVLTQLDRKKRTAVFEMYQGQSKVKLLAELSEADAIPKEYLLNVAQALQKKVKASPEYDTENLRSSDILLDLLERSSLQEQKKLMSTLQENNAETARSLKMKLVTVEILPYLKDGHLLEVILGMERESLLMFLAACPDHIRDLLINKAPEELADSWIEDLESIGAVDEGNSRMASMKVTNRIRNLANNGVISLLEINDMIFSQDHGSPEDQDYMPSLDSHVVAA
ncbi:FliG C-terminal domain-containing protein [Pseudobacteriovorax antillogorgiicola]|uniref:FliG middle domain-containing protein n=1 Tax=Pseudobacteriovorax antillogorgiicola TaxID=1513793 RepID=A0A1Y6B6C2_9BACT|nr:FliG C-terminal domain-containing protein [Pseudobacteriovorax antillogorgiicola]TCS58920.1 FliG-like protein [Pseudobacteriovorax antillogorgiicola]SME93142.1 FliG middle domain-containing protein [Pseudobacteriovorax antillogorgiicola]